MPQNPGLSKTDTVYSEHIIAHPGNFASDSPSSDLAPTSYPHNPRNLRTLALWYHKLGFNVLPTNDNKEPLVKWGQWRTQRQTLADVEAMPWARSRGIAAMCGAVSGGLVVVDFDKQIDRSAVDHFLVALDLSKDYSWLVQTPGGGWYVRLIVPDIPSDRTGRLDRPGKVGGHIELRYEGILAMLPPSIHSEGGQYIFVNTEPDGPPATVDPAHVFAAYDLVTEVPPVAPRRAEAKSKRYVDRQGQNTSLYEQYCLEVEAAAIRAWDIPPANDRELSRNNFSSPLREDRRPSAQWNFTVHGFKDYATEEFYSTADCAELLGFQTWKEYRDQHAHAGAAPARPTVVFEVKAFIGGGPNYYTDGVPLRVVELLNRLHINPWVRVDRGDVLSAKAFVALWVAWHQHVIAGELDPLQPVSMADLVRLTGLTKDTVRNALRFGEYGGFLSLYKESTRGKESHQNRRGKPGTYYVFRPLKEAWQQFLSEMEPLMWRALLIEKYPDLPVEALALDDLLGPQFGVTNDDIAVIDDCSQPLYEQYENQLFAASQCLRKRVDTWIDWYIYPDETIPLRLPERATFRNVAEFGDLLNELDMMAHKGERRGNDRYEIQDLTGRTAAAHRDSNKRLGIASIPDYDEYPVRENVDLLTQCLNISETAYERGQIRICAPNGATIMVSQGCARTFDYHGWLLDNGGYKGAIIQAWERSREKLESRLTEEERAMRDDVSRRQANISARRSIGIEKKPSRVATWLVAQGEMRAPLFGLQRIQDSQHPPRVLHVGLQGNMLEPADIWPGIIQAAQLEQAGSLPAYEAYIPGYVLESGETIDFAQSEG
jgi:hypothetical protein